MDTTQLKTLVNQKVSDETSLSPPAIASEARYGITAQPPDSCSLIDDALSDLEAALFELEDWEKCDEVGELKHKCDMGIWHADRLNGTLEKIRTRAAEIREWGQQWKNLAKEHAPMCDE